MNDQINTNTYTAQQAIMYSFYKVGYRPKETILSSNVFLSAKERQFFENKDHWLPTLHNRKKSEILINQIHATHAAQQSPDVMFRMLKNYDIAPNVFEGCETVHIVNLPYKDAASVPCLCQCEWEYHPVRNGKFFPLDLDIIPVSNFVHAKGLKALVTGWSLGTFKHMKTNYERDIANAAVYDNAIPSPPEASKRLGQRLWQAFVGRDLKS